MLNGWYCCALPSPRSFVCGKRATKTFFFLFQVFCAVRMGELFNMRELFNMKPHCRRCHGRFVPCATWENDRAFFRFVSERRQGANICPPPKKNEIWRGRQGGVPMARAWCAKMTGIAVPSHLQNQLCTANNATNRKKTYLQHRRGGKIRVSRGLARKGEDRILLNIFFSSNVTKQVNN